jgi:riboflavin synthase
VGLPSSASQGLALGASVAIDGVCLSVSGISGQNVAFDIMQETLSRTTLSTIEVGQEVNFERSAHANSEIGGHIVSGHIDCTSRISSISSPENNLVLTFNVKPAWMKYIFSKGFVALNGCSLTVTNADHASNTFQVWFIPETLRLTTFGVKQVGDSVNLEVERSTQVIVDTVERFLESNLARLAQESR